MLLKDLIELIKTNNYLFEVCLPCGKKWGKKTLYDVRNEYGELEDYIRKIAKPNEQEAITVKLYGKNGTGPKKKGSVEIFINEQNETNGLNEINKKNETNTINDIVLQNATNNLTKKNIVQMISKADIDVVQLKTENKYLAEKVEELKARNKELERKNDEYYNENLRLTREHATEKDKRDLEYKQKELDLLAKQKQGLSGVLEDVKTLPPEAWQFIAGLLPNHPMAKGLLPAPAQNNNALSGANKHNDPDAQACIEVMDALLLKQSPEIVGMSAMLTEHLVTNPTVLKAVYDKFFPEQSNNEKTK